MLLFCGEETKSIIGYILLSFLFTLNIMYDNVNMVQCLQEEVISKLQERMHQPGLASSTHFIFVVSLIQSDKTNMWHVQGYLQNILQY